MVVTYLENRQRGRGKFYLAAHEQGTPGRVLFNWGPCGAVGQASDSLDTNPHQVAAAKVRAKLGRGYHQLASTEMSIAEVGGQGRELAVACHEGLAERGRAAVSDLLGREAATQHVIVEEVSTAARGPWTRGAWQAMEDCGAVLAADGEHDVAWLRVPRGSAGLAGSGLAAAGVVLPGWVGQLDEEFCGQVLGTAASLGEQAGDWSERLAVAAKLFV